MIREIDDNICFKEIAGPSQDELVPGGLLVWKGYVSGKSYEKTYLMERNPKSGGVDLPS